VTDPSQLPKSLTLFADTTVLGIDLETCPPEGWVPSVAVTDGMAKTKRKKVAKQIEHERKEQAVDPYRNRIRLVSLSDGTTTLVIDAFAVPDWPRVLQPLFDRTTVVTHNALFEYSHFLKVGLQLPTRSFDTMIAAQILDAGRYLPGEAGCTVPKGVWSGTLYV
jgi:hypothetical protein